MSNAVQKMMGGASADSLPQHATVLSQQASQPAIGDVNNIETKKEQAKKELSRSRGRARSRTLTEEDYKQQSGAAAPMSIHFHKEQVEESTSCQSQSSISTLSLAIAARRNSLSVHGERTYPGAPHTGEGQETGRIFLEDDSFPCTVYFPFLKPSKVH
jgi:hypothetical protein